jgi:chromosome segregation ATPase
MNALRATNKELRDAVSRIKKHDISSSSHRLSMTPIEKLDHRICEIHKKYDDLQLEARSKEAKLKALKDQLDELKKDGDTVKANIQDSPNAKQIRGLENRLDKAMIKYNEAQSIRKTYEQIMKRLQEERLTFDTQLANFEKTLKTKKMDAAQLEMMSRDANHAKEVAKVINILN